MHNRSYSRTLLVEGCFFFSLFIFFHITELEIGILNGSCTLKYTFTFFSTYKSYSQSLIWDLIMWNRLKPVSHTVSALTLFKVNEETTCAFVDLWVFSLLDGPIMDLKEERLLHSHINYLFDRTNLLKVIRKTESWSKHAAVAKCRKSWFLCGSSYGNVQCLCHFTFSTFLNNIMRLLSRRTAKI